MRQTIGGEMQRSVVKRRVFLVALYLPFPLLLFTVGVDTTRTALTTFVTPLVIQVAAFIWARREDFL
jgi:hypothetical protein